MQTLKISFIGGGNMAEALIAGLLQSKHDPQSIHVSEPRQARRSELSEQYGIKTTAENSEAARGSDILVLAVKPQQMRDAVRSLAGSLGQEATLVSIAAGVRTSSLTEWLGDAAHIVRVMPNTPALVSEGMSVLFSKAAAIYRQRAEYVLKSCGEVAWVDHEDQLHAVTAVSGSGPAYFFLLAEMMQAAGVSLGLPKALAEKLATQTALGAGRMLCESGRSAEALRHQVTSPGGTTQAALDVMYEMGLPDAVRKGVVAASKRSAELG
jgi:pyrroline-5-carboxylate reductase